MKRSCKMIMKCQKNTLTESAKEGKVLKEPGK